jgi:hypothetical protein
MEKGDITPSAASTDNGYVFIQKLAAGHVDSPHKF